MLDRLLLGMLDNLIHLVWLIKRCRRCVGLQGQKIVALLLRQFSCKRVLRVAGGIKCFSHEQQKRAVVAQANLQCLLPAAALDFTATSRRRRLLDFYATWGQDAGLKAQLRSCSDLLGMVIKAHSDHPVILAPLHMVSDILTGIVASQATDRQTTMLVSANAEAFDAVTRRMGGVNIDYCSIHNNEKQIGQELSSICLDVVDGLRELVIFPDIVPEYTSKAVTHLQGKLFCRLFGRPAQLHNGIIRLAKITKANVLFFHLYYDDDVKIKIYPVVNYLHLSKQMPAIIETAIRGYPQDWLLWHAHCLYFMNEGSVQ